jgi:hypothetical protein
MVAHGIGCGDRATEGVGVGGIALDDCREVLERRALGSGGEQELCEVKPDGNGAWIALDGRGKCR